MQEVKVKAEVYAGFTRKILTSNMRKAAEQSREIPSVSNYI